MDVLCFQYCDGFRISACAVTRVSPVERESLTCHSFLRSCSLFDTKLSKNSPRERSLSAKLRKRMLTCEGKVKALTNAVEKVVNKEGAYLSCPLDSLDKGRWVKLICGASFEDSAEVRNLCLVYTLAGVDCIDCAADRAVVEAVLAGIEAANNVIAHCNLPQQSRPWVMVSINDDEDVHFRKAEFDPKLCPPDCPRPCESICPASAIQFHSRSLPASSATDTTDGVLVERCYGCGRCLPVCPFGLIEARSYVRSVDSISDLLQGGLVDALEIHTGPGHVEAFRRLWEQLGPDIQQLKLLAVSLPSMVELEQAMWDMHNCMQPLTPALLWQLDGRPMSGDIGRGATTAAVSLATRVLASSSRPPGYVQLAGGTNAATVSALTSAGIFAPSFRSVTVPGDSPRRPYVSGVAYGGYARKIVGDFMKKQALPETRVFPIRLEDFPDLLAEVLLEVWELLRPFRAEVGDRLLK